MSKLHPRTSFAVLLVLAAFVVWFFKGWLSLAMVLALLAFFSALSELSKFTSWYQFSVIFLAATCVGLFPELFFLTAYSPLPTANSLLPTAYSSLPTAYSPLPTAYSPLLTLSMMVAAKACLCRIVFFRIFAYTRFRYFEILLTGLSFLLYLIGNLLVDYGWQGWAFPAPIIAFSFYFSWGILQDQSQLLASVRGGYKVKTGQPAADFSLPDQDGNTVQLSQFKNKRHVLLIFVRGDWCPGCHMMLRTYEKNNTRFQEKNILVMAIGPDPVGVNKAMVEKLGLDFKVLADEGQRTAMTYGVQIREYENAMAEKYKEGIPLPASFLIDSEGIVRYVSRPDKVGEFLNPSLIFPIVEQLK